jgi:hypothetical protein
MKAWEDGIKGVSCSRNLQIAQGFALSQLLLSNWQDNFDIHPALATIYIP